MATGRICVGAIAGAHGVRGLLRVKSHTAVPEDLVAYGPLTDETGQRRFALSLKGRNKGLLLAPVEGVADRDAAEALRGTQLFVERAALPAAEDEETFYHADLIGMAAMDRAGRELGRIKAVQNYGAGDLLEIDTPDGSLLLPFTRQVVPEVDLEAGRVVVEPPGEVEAKPEKPSGKGERQ